MKKRTLITSALPYVNGPLHIGHLIGCLLPSDVYARFRRAQGDEVLYVCGSDEHGTPIIIGAANANMPIEQYATMWHEKQSDAVRNFNLSFDYYGRTHTQKQIELVQSLFARWDELGLIEERVTSQPFSKTDDMFLADRQIKGTCPHCGYDGADGDQCERCSANLEPRELINPHSAISGASDIEFRDTKHLYFKYSAMENALREWVNSRDGWSKTAMAIANKWLAEGLQDTPITRDLKWGIPVNKAGFEDKVFYVWFDAPWGYVSISEYTNSDWKKWWKNPDTHYAQFMGKDNVSFHSVFFPAQCLALNDNWKTVDQLKGLNFLNFEGNKISKSKGNGVFLDGALEFAGADEWRYALLASAPESDDTDFTIQRFADIVNKDLNGILGNFVSRVTKITEKNFGLAIPSSVIHHPSSIENSINSKLSELTIALNACEFRKSIEALRSLWSIGNEYFTKTEPWNLVKTDRDAAGAVLAECFNLIEFYARISAPFIPATAEKMLSVVSRQSSDLSWPTEYTRFTVDGSRFTIPENLFERIDDDKIKSMTEKYTKQSPKIVVAKILTAEPHPDSDHLHILTVDGGDGIATTVVCGAPNARAGLVGVWAKPGAYLPAMDLTLSARKVRGVLSNGMMCAPDELGQGANHDGIIELPDDSIIGSEFKI